MVLSLPFKVQNIVRKVLSARTSPPSSPLNASAFVHVGKLGADARFDQYSSPPPKPATVSDPKVASSNAVDSKGEDAYDGDLEDNDACDSEYNFPFSPWQTMKFEEVRDILAPSQHATVCGPRPVRAG